MEPIDRDEFIAMLNEDHIPYDARINSILMSVPVLKVIPAKFHNKNMGAVTEEKNDMVKVVYCKDCKYFAHMILPNIREDDPECFSHKICGKDENRWIEDDDYCSWGVRASDN